MPEIQPSVVFEHESNPSVEELFNQLLEQEPKPIANFVPTNAAEQKELFLNGEVRNPDHVYGKLDVIDFDDRFSKIQNIGANLITHPDIPEKYTGVYEQFVDNYMNKTRFMQLAHTFKHAASEDERADARDEFMRLNVELFGEPDKNTYQSILNDKLKRIKEKKLTGNAATIRDELFELIGHEEIEVAPRFKPEQETIDWLHDIIDSDDSLYGSMLEHVPEQETFTAEEIQKIFQDIITDEFGLELASRPEDAGILWQVDIEDAQSINVKAAEKRLVVPNGRELSLGDMRGRVVHEVGIHFLRSIMGEQTDLMPLKLGLSDYYDTEEGLGVVMEQALKGEFREAGDDHYITAGLAYFENKDFRDIFEIKWRLNALKLAKGDLTDAQVAKSKGLMYGSTMRFERGTDELPWFKDLAYYNGATDVWKHLEAIRGDDTEFMLVLMGKANAADSAHRRVLLETATVVDDEPAKV